MNSPRSRPAVASALLAAALAVTALVLAGCSSSKLDTSKAERAISQQLAAKYPGAGVGATTCPRQVKLTKGDSFTCTTALAGGQHLEVTVTQEDNKGNVSLEWHQAVAVVDRIAADVAKQLTATYEKQVAAGQSAPLTQPVKVDCGTPKVRLIPPGKSFDCTATANGQTSVWTVTVKDLNVNVTYAQKEPAPPAAPPQTVP